MKIDAGAKSDVGQKREINEDYFYVDNTSGLFIVCDGLGGHSAGEVASTKAVEYTIEYLQERWSEVKNARQTPIGYFRLTHLVEKAIHNTCLKINKMASLDPELNGMATTLTLLLIVDGNAVVGHVGDSRLYIMRNGQVNLLTTDHTLYHEMMTEFGDVDPNEIGKFAHCLTRSVGNHESVAVETLMFEARPNDVLLLCTDGLSIYFDDDSILAELLGGNDVNAIADSLVRFANQNGGTDNITAVVIRIVDVDDFKINAHRITLDYSTEVDPASR